MTNSYLLIILGSPLLCAFLQFFWGFENIKSQEFLKAFVSKFIYFIQFVFSVYGFFAIEKTQVSLMLVHLEHYHYDAMFLLQKSHFFLASIFSLLFILTEKLSFNYLHAEEEHSKFYSLKMILNFSMMAFVFSQNIDFLFFCWEIVGLSSALLISYFYRRNQAVENSLYAFTIYRICDAAFLLSALLLYHLYQVERIDHMASGPYATILGLLIFFTIMGKSGLYPMSSWLPQALEGPTPSSNLYYMTLSTHLGPILLLKSYPLWESSQMVKMIMIAGALVTIVLTSISARVQTTIKGALAYSTLAQVAFIIIEIVIGWHTFALIHIGLHIFHRLAQMALSPSIIDQHNLMEKLSSEYVHYKVRGRIYFLGLNCFRSEIIIKQLINFFFLPFILLDRIENALLGDEIKQEDMQMDTIYRGSVK